MPRPLPDLESLRCFVEAADTLNFRAAARRVALTPTALGQRIQQLEALFEARLFDRTTRRVALTDAGRALLPQAQATLAAARGCHRAARGEDGPAPLSLTLGTRHELGLSWLMPALPGLEAALPHVTFHLYFGSGPDLSRRVVARQLDAAIHSSPVVDPGLEADVLHREDYALVGAPGLLGREPVADLLDLGAHTLVDISPEQPLLRYWSSALEPGQAARFARGRWMGTLDAIRALVLSGEGLAVLPVYRIEGDLAAGTLTRVLPDIQPQADHFRLLYRRDDPRAATLSQVAAHLRACPLR